MENREKKQILPLLGIRFILTIIVLHQEMLHGWEMLAIRQKFIKKYLKTAFFVFVLMIKFSKSA